MSRSRSAPGRGRRWCGLAPLVVLLAACMPAAPPEVDETKVRSDPPPATAPPDPGVLPPPVRLLPPGTPRLTVDQRPQRQLTAWSESMADGLNIPRAALQAYGYAQRALHASRPRCGLVWPLLAGIGAVESSHGRYGGAKLDTTGRPSIPIRGMPLDGHRGVKRIDDTDHGALDGDSRFDRAVGPLQFLPRTWHTWAVDADGDGTADPNDVDDAALTAARYLCATGVDLRNPAQFWKAMLTYNESRSYGQEVLDYADEYGRVSHTLPVR